MINVRRAAVLVVGAAAAGAAAMSAVSAPSATAHTKNDLSRFYQQRLGWKACTQGPDDEVGKELDKAGARCADVTVPLDYADPGGRTITVGISRLKASGDEPRLGMMLLNGGGPGAAIDLPPYMRELMGKAGPRYDLVGMDPRALGRSAGIDCGWPSATWIKGPGATRAAFDASVRYAKDLADRCARTDASVLPHISTRNIARDMDVIRGALGERKMSYNGASYGTYLGSVYATMFPGRLDRVLLDSSQDPYSWGPRLLAGTENANEKALADWAGWAAERDDEYGLGKTRDEVVGLVHRILAASARAPLAIGQYKLDASMLPVVLVDNLGTDDEPARAGLAESVRVLRDAAAGRPAKPTPDLDDELAYLLTGTDSREGSGQAAIICGDVAAPRDPAFYWRDVQAHRGGAPVFGALAHNIGPCAFWPTRPAEAPTKVGADLPALMVAATGDTRTTYERNETVHRLMRGSRMITLDANVHAPYQRGYPNTCVRERVNDYLLTGRLPARDLTCPPDK
ncbi:alpha/beta hydrolase [Actinomadura litoris]|uniref:alpha/beta hydrolase n=1 Tax=Actinomadura litoris TaxID=2678616 RepID=UPI001FA7FC54|nr:alpha/beta hydrolase [Actinomadura litoris]